MADIKVVNTIVGDDEISSVIDIVSGIEASESAKERIKAAVGEYLIEQTLLYVGNTKSPISGESWPGLSPSYKQEKAEAGQTPVANLEATGNMLSAIDFETTDTGIKIGIFGGEALKADGHNNFSGESELPKRRFLPTEDQVYKRDISKGIDEIINDILADDVQLTRDDFEDVETKSQLLSVLETGLGIKGAAKIERAVLGNDKLRDLLIDLGLLDLL